MRREEPSRFHSIFGLDYRSLALCRFLFAIVVIGTIFYPCTDDAQFDVAGDLLDRASDLYAHYSDGGVIPRITVMNYFWNTNWISLHMMNGTVRWQGFLFLVQGLAAACMAVGFYTKFSAFVTWFMLTSLHGRNPLVLHGGDVFMRCILFWLLFLPIEKVASIDAALKRDPATHKRRSHWVRATAATAAFMVQYFLVYRTSATLKTGKEWTEEFSASFYAISLDYFRTWLGELLLRYPALLQLLTLAVLWWEYWGGLFLFSPVYVQTCRLIGVLGFVAMHLGFGLSLRLGTFFYISLAIAAALLPSLFWEMLLRRLRTPQRMALKVYYSPSSTWSQIVARLLCIVLIPDTIFATMQPRVDPEALDRAEPTSTYLKCTDYYGTVYSGYSALVFILSQSPLLWPLGWLLNLEAIPRNNVVLCYFFYSIVSYVDSADPMPPPLQRPKRRPFKLLLFALKSIFVGICTLTAIAWCLSNLGYVDYAPGFSARGVAYLSHLDQSWGMFAPRPPDTDYYYVFEGQLDDGRMVELFNNGGFTRWEIQPLSWDKPTSATNGISNHRWFKIFEAYNSNSQSQQIRLELGKYVCREWNRRHVQKDRVYTYKVWLMPERHLLNGTVVPQTKQMLWNHVCYDR